MAVCFRSPSPRGRSRAGSLRGLQHRNGAGVSSERRPGHLWDGTFRRGLPRRLEVGSWAITSAWHRLPLLHSGEWSHFRRTSDLGRRQPPSLCIRYTAESPRPGLRALPFPRRATALPQESAGGRGINRGGAAHHSERIPIRRIPCEIWSAASTDVISEKLVEALSRFIGERAFSETVSGGRRKRMCWHRKVLHMGEP